MQKVIAIAGVSVLALVRAEHFPESQIECCPKQCPTQHKQMCCQKCPASCVEHPGVMNPISIAAEADCKWMKVSWNAPISCSPIQRTQIQCLGSDMQYWDLPPVIGLYTELTFTTEVFTKTPFFLKPGVDAFNCRIRSQNKLGWGMWSMQNQPVTVPSCNKPVIASNSVTQKMPTFSMGATICPCKPSCRSTGCGGCCKDQENYDFWLNIQQRYCCEMGTCECPNKITSAEQQSQSTFVSPPPQQPAKFVQLSTPVVQVPKDDEWWNRVVQRLKEADQATRQMTQVPKPVASEHTHKVCEVDPKMKNRTITKRVMKKQMVKKMQTVVKPVGRIVKHEGFKKMKVVTPKLTFKTETITQKQTKLVPKTVKVKKYTMVKKNGSRKEIKYNKVKKTVKEVQTKKVARTIPKIKMIKKTVEMFKVEYDTKVVKRQALRKVKKTEYVTQRQLKKGGLMELPAESESCKCYKQECACVSELNCQCCYPKCDCAPKLANFEPYYETIIVEEVKMVDEPYEISEEIQVPRIVKVEVVIEEPTEFFEQIDEDVPYVVMTEVMVAEPVIVDVPYEFEEPAESEVDVTVNEPVTTTVSRDVQVPEYINVETEKMVPFVTEEEVFENKEVEEEIEVEENVPVSIEEKIPDPPCQWVDVTHSHENSGFHEHEDVQSLP